MSAPGAIPRFPFVAVDVPEELAEAMTGVFFELGAGGVEQRDASTLAKNRSEGTVTLVASFESHEDALAAIEAIDEELAPRLEEVIGDDWRDAWKEHFKPFALAEGVVVRPPWEAYEAKSGERVLVLEPGRAFGTGLHETTRLVARALAAHRSELQGQTVLDVGTGSGILALVALAFGAARAVAVDNDADCIPVVRENAERNAMGGAVDASTTDVAAVAGTFPVVVANIEARVLVPLAPAIGARVAPGGLLVLSGILRGQEDEVRAAYTDFDLLANDVLGEWVGVSLRKHRK
jgi:ribosomal protein L11 methyltransferase